MKLIFAPTKLNVFIPKTVVTLRFPHYGNCNGVAVVLQWDCSLSATPLQFLFCADCMFATVSLLFFSKYIGGLHEK